jgi:hypothetical protein
MTPLDKWSARCWGLYLHTEFEPATPATKRPQTYALDRAATGIGHQMLLMW